MGPIFVTASSRKGIVAHHKMISDLLSFEIKEGDRVVWFDILPNRLGVWRNFLRL